MTDVAEDNDSDVTMSKHKRESMPHDYETTWRTYRQRVTQAEAAYAQCLRRHAGTHATIEVCLNDLYRAATGCTPAVICALGNVAHPADALRASHLLLLLVGLRSHMARIEGWPEGGYQPGVPPQAELDAELHAIVALEQAQH